jgi:hypothetical protein
LRDICAQKSLEGLAFAEYHASESIGINHPFLVAGQAREGNSMNEFTITSFATLKKVDERRAELMTVLILSVQCTRGTKVYEMTLDKTRGLVVSKVGDSTARPPPKSHK